MRKIKYSVVLILVIYLLSSCTPKESKQYIKISYTNPVLHADYSDPDVIQSGDKYYMTASSFNCVPGLPLLESENLVDWKLINYALPELYPDSVFSKPQHGNGVWAPSMRFHNNKYYIFYGDPDYGIYMLSADSINGKWSKPWLVKAGNGWIDPCPLWDDDGRAWLVHAWAGSRAGIKSTLMLHQMSPDGKALLDNGIIIFDGHDGNATVEGPKLYKHNGYYYVFAPAGGVTFGWQLVLRSKDITGPYEVRQVLHQGSSQINGPHQGAWVTGPDGSSWFIHFQDKGAFGRIVHLQPMLWNEDWPAMGIDIDKDGIGEPVFSGEINALKDRPEYNPDQFSDEFNTSVLNLNWQWHANPTARYGAPTGHLGYLRLNASPFNEIRNLWEAPNLLLQKFPAENFSATTKLNIHLKEEGDKSGLLIMGYDYAWIGIQRKNNQNQLVYVNCHDAYKKGTEQTLFTLPYALDSVFLKVQVAPDATCKFSYSADNKSFTAFDKSFTALPGKWIGAKVGLFCIGSSTTNDAGYVNIDWFRMPVGE